MHNTILKQQESLVKQQQVFTDYLQTESTLRKEQTALMQKQLNALIALAPSKARVPSAHQLMVYHLTAQCLTRIQCKQLQQILYQSKVSSLHPYQCLSNLTRNNYWHPTWSQLPISKSRSHLASEPNLSNFPMIPVLHRFNPYCKVATKTLR